MYFKLPNKRNLTVKTDESEDEDPAFEEVITPPTINPIIINYQKSNYKRDIFIKIGIICVLLLEYTLVLSVENRFIVASHFYISVGLYHKFIITALHAYLTMWYKLDDILASTDSSINILTVNQNQKDIRYFGYYTSLICDVQSYCGIILSLAYFIYQVKLSQPYKFIFVRSIIKLVSSYIYTCCLKINKPKME